MASSLQMQLVQARDALFPRQSCARKARYTTHQAAKGALRKRQEAEGIALYQYRCPECDGWHLTKRPQIAAPEDFA